MANADSNGAMTKLADVRKELQDMLFQEMREPKPDPKEGYAPRDARPVAVICLARAIADVDDAMKSVDVAYKQARR